MRLQLSKQITGFCVFLLAIASLQGATPIAVIGTSSSSELVSHGRLAANTVDGKFGADGIPTDMGGVWESSGIGFGSPQDDRAPKIDWDFGQAYQVERMEVWNFWEASPAIKRAVIERSDDGQSYSDVREVLIYPWSNAQNPTRLELTNVVARHIRLRAVESYGGDVYPVAVGTAIKGLYGFVGLAEVRFWGALLSPAVSGFQEWYRADSAQFAGLADGQPITTWLPEAGSSAIPTPTQVSGQEIVYRRSVAGLNGHPALEFPGGPSALREIGNIDFNDVSMFLVFRNIGSGGLQRPLAGLDSNTLMGPWNPAQAGRYNPAIHLNGVWKIHPEDVVGWSDPGACVLSLVINATDTERSFINGVEINSTHGSPGPMNTSGIGRLSFNGSTELFKGYIAEFILYKRTLPPDETERVHNYLLVKYGLRTGAATGPSITLQPISQTVDAKQNVEFHVTATGTEPLSYQWRKNGNVIDGATSATLQLSGVTTNAAGSYTVVVSNAGGTVTSEAAILIVRPPSAAPIALIGASASSELVSYGRLAAHTVDAKFGADGIPTDMGSVWESSGIGFGSPQDDRAPKIDWDFGQSYQVERMDIWNFWESSPAIKRAILERSDDGQIYREIREVLIDPWVNAQNPTRLELTNVVARHIRLRAVESYGGDVYPVAVGTPIKGFAGFVGLAEVRFWGTLPVETPPTGPSITVQPVSQTALAKQNVEFQFTATGSEPLTYQWRKDGSPIASATNATLQLSGVTTNAAGSYIVVVSNAGEPSAAKPRFSL